MEVVPRFLRYRCGVPGCPSAERTCISHMIRIELLAAHYAALTRSNRHFNYQCNHCGAYAFLEFATSWCSCLQSNGAENQWTRIATGRSRRAARRFLNYVRRYAIPGIARQQPG
uniref:Transposase n=1 Tax=Angiostrongylus cantonensis TaxID=6313 RepID=A0A0K0D6H3_ANGCA